jgi:hypothetical protein
MPSVTLYPTMPHYAAVGRVASKWAMLEHQIQSLIWGLAGLDEMTGTCITSQIGHSGRLMDALLALLKQKRFEEGPAASPLVKRMLGSNRECATGSYTIPGSTTTGRQPAIGSNRAPPRPPFGS